MIGSIAYVIPTYRTADTLSLLIDRIDATAPRFSERHEVVVVDDACPERSGETVAGRTGVRSYRLDANTGQRTAVLTGMTRVDADLVCVLDADLQDDPASVESLVAHLTRTGADVVCAGRRGEHQPPARRVQAWGFRAMRWVATRGTVPRDAGLFHVATIEAVQAMRSTASPGDDPLVAYAATGATIASLPVMRHRRSSGTSGYTTARRLSMAAATARTVVRTAPTEERLPTLYEIQATEET